MELNIINIKVIILYIFQYSFNNSNSDVLPQLVVASLLAIDGFKDYITSIEVKYNNEENYYYLNVVLNNTLTSLDILLLNEVILWTAITNGYITQ